MSHHQSDRSEDHSAEVRIDEAFLELVELPDAERVGRLRVIAQTDPALAEVVRRWLKAYMDDSPALMALANSDADGTDAPGSAIPDTPFGSFYPTRVLGHGGMGVVYHAIEEGSLAEVAIKCPLPSHFDATSLERFRREMQLLAALEHPAIVRFRSSGYLPNGMPWFAMDYVADGEPITTWSRRRSWTLTEMLRHFDSLCEVIRHVHQLGGHVHRDLKPKNVLVTKDGQVKVLDFGLAKEWVVAAEHPSRTETIDMTTRYAAPEQIAGRPTGPPADVYAIGMILHEILTGCPPYSLEGAPWERVQEIVQEGYPPRVEAERDGYSNPWRKQVGRRDWEDLNALLAKALAPDVGDRYGSVEALRADLHAFLDGKPLDQAVPVTRWRYRARKFARRQRRSIAAAAILTVMAAATLVSYTRSITQARRDELAEAARTARMRYFLENMFEGGGPAGERVDSIRVGTLVENGVREVFALAHDPGLQIDLLSTIGIMRRRLGDFAGADSMFAHAANRAVALYGDGHAETIRIRVRRASLAPLDSALAVLGQLDAAAQGHARRGHPVGAEIDLAIGTLLRQRDSLPEAVTRLQRAVDRRRRQDPASQDYGEALRELGITYAAARDLPLADSIFRLALPIVERQLGPTHPDAAALYSSLGAVASGRGFHTEAEGFHRSALRATAAWYGEHHLRTAVMNHNLAQTLIRLFRFDEAIPLLRSTLESFALAPDIGLESDNALIVRSTLAVALTGAEDFPAALRENQAAFEGLRRTRGLRHRTTITVWTNLAAALDRTGLRDSAVRTMRTVLDSASSYFPDSHPDVAHVRVKLGELLAAAGEYREAIAVTLQGLRVVDSLYTRSHQSAQLGRMTLKSAYSRLGDSIALARVNAELADTVARPPQSR